LPVRHPFGALDGGLTGGCSRKFRVLSAHAQKTSSYHFHIIEELPSSGEQTSALGMVFTT